tara:strand:- start:1982 stop:2761 length:780 start_codon:yes stop_codon:yes gene_type:complete
MADAETFKMMAVIEMDAKGAIKDTEVLDAKFSSLGNTMQKGKSRAEGAKEAQDKLNTSIKQGGKATTEANVSTIKNLALMEAATSGFNQLISAQYKKIDAALAEGRINEEEAARQRKAVKRQEKYTGTLEQGIAVMRLGTVAHAMYVAATSITTAGIKANTVAVLTLNGALYANPLLWVVGAVVIMLGVLIALELKFGLVTKAVDASSEAFEAFGNWLNGARDSLMGLGEDMQEFADNTMDKLGFVGDLISGSPGGFVR